MWREFFFSGPREPQLGPLNMVGMCETYRCNIKEIFLIRRRLHAARRGRAFLGNEGKSIIRCYALHWRRPGLMGSASRQRRKSRRPTGKKKVTPTNRQENKVQVHGQTHRSLCWTVSQTTAHVAQTSELVGGASSSTVVCNGQMHASRMHRNLDLLRKGQEISFQMYREQSIRSSLAHSFSPVRARLSASGAESFYVDRIRRKQRSTVSSRKEADETTSEKKCAAAKARIRAAKVSESIGKRNLV